MFNTAGASRRARSVRTAGKPPVALVRSRSMIGVEKIASPPSLLPERPPMELWAVLAVCVIAAVAMTPSVLIALGPLRESLTSDVDSIRATAELTVLIARSVCVIAAVCLAGLLVFWKTVSTSQILRPLSLFREQAVDPALARNLSRRSLILSLVAFVLAVSYASFIAQMLPLSLRDAIGREDGVVEQATALMFLIAAVGSFAAAFQWAAARHRQGPTAARRSVWLVLLGLFFVVCVGEEISWGQRMFGFETTETLQRINVQGEMNIHNAFGYLADHLYIAGVFIYGGLLPLLTRRYEFWRRATAWLGLPIATIGLAIGFILVSTIHDWTLYRIVPYTSEVRAAELRELLSAFCFSLFMLEVWVVGKTLSRK